MSNSPTTFSGGHEISFAGACVMSVIFLVAGSAMLFYACKFYVREQAFLAHATHTQGTIVAFVQRKGSHQSIDYSPVFTFADPTGQVWHVTSATSNGRPAYAVGATVPVLYHPEHPEQAQLETFASAWELVPVLGGFGSATLLGGCLGVRQASRLRGNKKELPRDPTIPVRLVTQTTSGYSGSPLNSARNSSSNVRSSLTICGLLESTVLVSFST